MHSFFELRNEIKLCSDCSFNDKHSSPLYFQCLKPENVRVLVISEQPHETNNKIDETLVKKCLKKEITASDTILAIAEIFSNKYTNSILSSEGEYYWTHQTKCPSSSSEPKKHCSKKWFKKEIGIFSNLQYIVSFGADAFEALTKVCDHISYKKFGDYLWEEIKMVVLGEYKLNRLCITISNKNYCLIALPHPSGKNSLRIFLPHLKPLIMKIEENKEL